MTLDDLRDIDIGDSVCLVMGTCAAELPVDGVGPMCSQARQRRVWLRWSAAATVPVLLVAGGPEIRGRADWAHEPLCCAGEAVA